MAWLVEKAGVGSTVTVLDDRVIVLVVTVVETCRVMRIKVVRDICIFLNGGTRRCLTRVDLKVRVHDEPRVTISVYISWGYRAVPEGLEKCGKLMRYEGILAGRRVSHIISEGRQANHNISFYGDLRNRNYSNLPPVATWIADNQGTCVDH